MLLGHLVVLIVLPETSTFRRRGVVRVLDVQNVRFKLLPVFEDPLVYVVEPVAYLDFGGFRV